MKLINYLYIFCSVLVGALYISAVVSSDEGPDSIPLALAEIPPVSSYHDDINNVTCWYTTQHNSSIYCISDSELAFQRSRLSFSEVVYFD